MKLRKKLIRNFLGLIVFSIAIISLIANIMINSRFEGYLIHERESKFQRIHQEINQQFLEDGGQLDPMELKHYALAEDITLIIEDSQGSILYNTDQTSSMMGRGKHGNQHGHMPGRHRQNQGEYLEKDYPLLSGNEQVGKLIIGYLDKAYMTQGALIFKDTLFKAILLAGIIAIIIGLLLSLILSKKLSQPLIEIENKAREIQEGKLGEQSSPETNIKEIQDLAQTINFLSTSLAQQDNIRKSYASDISHELRTPLTTIKAHLEGMIDGVWDSKEENLQLLLDEIERLSKLIDDLQISFSQEEEGLELNKSVFDLSQEIKDLTSIYKPIYESKNFILQASYPNQLLVNMDRDKIRQAISNLLENALKYLGDDGKVQLLLSDLGRDSQIQVKDNGQGIREENLPLIFQRFYREDPSRHKDTGGSGLGLSIVKSIVEAHGGRIKVQSQYGKGSSFTIEIEKGLAK